MAARLDRAKQVVYVTGTQEAIKALLGWGTLRKYVVWECMGFDFIFSPSDDIVPETRVRGAFYCGEFEGESLPFSFGFSFFWCNEPTVTREPCLLEAARQAIESLSGAVQPTLTGSTQADTKQTLCQHKVGMHVSIGHTQTSLSITERTIMNAPYPK